MRSGPIGPEVRTLAIDRRDVSYTLWEQASGVTPDLPWASADSLAAQDVSALLSSARTAALVVGRSDAAAALLDHVLGKVAPSCRLYIYGSSAWEADQRMRSRLGAIADRVLTRLGFEPPADWLVVDHGRAALLLLGPAGEPRRWSIVLDGALARTLYESFRVLFWFHAAREGLPDAAGTFGFRRPLASPFANPGSDIFLPSGRLTIDGPLPDAIADAEIRIATKGAAPGRAGIVFLPPNSQDFTTPVHLTSATTRVVWSEAGLPTLAISPERLVVDLVEAPVSLQLEWPRADAVDMYHRLQRSAQSPKWRFYAQRRLADVAGAVLLQGAEQVAAVTDSEVVPAPNVTTSPELFAEAQPDNFPEPPQLVRSVTYKWTVLPATVPPGAREAELVRQWRAVDEWAARQVSDFRQALLRMEGEERGFLDRLRRWLPGHKDLRQQRSQLGQKLTDLGEAPPSQRFYEAKETVRLLGEAGQEVRQMIEKAHAGRLNAETSEAEEQQRTAWKLRVEQAAQELATKTTELVRHKTRESAAALALEEAEKQLAATISQSRDARKAALELERERIATALIAVNQQLRELPTEKSAPPAGQDKQSGKGKKKPNKGNQQPGKGKAQAGADSHQSGEDKQQRRELASKATEFEQTAARIKRDLDTLRSWSPAPQELAAEYALVSQARAARNAASNAASAGAAEVRRLEPFANEKFNFKPPPRLPEPAIPPDATTPAVPDEEAPELGQLFENRGKRFLAIKTWEQVQPAIAVARRLRAELVSISDKNK